MDTTLRALNRFGLGARPGDRARIGEPRQWLRRQLDGRAPTVEAPPGTSPADIGAALTALRTAQQGDRAAQQEARQRITRIAAAEMRTALSERLRSERPFVERLVAFWSNHLCVSAQGKFIVAPLAGWYERDVIRPQVLGRFEDMVLASARHPAMLTYLDNFQSIGPSSRAARLGQRAGAQRGLNENYARELLELHTLGVDGGYTQDDVLELARVLTGWTITGLGRGARLPRMMQNARGDDGEAAFRFEPLLHEPGIRTVLGRRYEDDGQRQGERVIHDLCRHPSTARFVARKLVTHFVADEPPAAAVDRIAGVFTQSDGDLRAVSAALIELPEAWSADTKKFRTPQDWLVAMLRAFNAPAVDDTAVALLRQLRQPLWAPPAPKGWGDTTREWADPESLLNRAELARTLTRRVMRRAPDPRLILDVVDVPDSDPLRTTLADSGIPADERIALGLAGPAFQWR